MAGQLTIDTLKASSGVLATQNGMTGIAKAWCYFTYSGSVAIQGSFNVSSVTRISTGRYTVTFTTAMPSANYCIAGAVNNTGSVVNIYGGTNTTTSFDYLSGVSGSGQDNTYNMVTVTGA